MVDFIFVHGWGMDSGIWEEVAAGFPDARKHYVDLGFIGNKSCESVPDFKAPIYVTHSLGTAWALKHHGQDMQALIAINGFVCFQNFADERTLKTMQRRIQRSPEIQMEEFWRSCGFKNNLDQSLNKDRLHQGLEWLKDWDVSNILASLDIPVLSLSGGHDAILPLAQMKQEWVAHDIKIVEEGGHILPLSHASWCIEQIEGFVSELERECRSAI